MRRFTICLSVAHAVLVLLVLIGLSGSQRINAQSSNATAQPQFEIASIKPGGDINQRGISIAPGGRFSARAVTLQQLIRTAYAVQDYQISEGPDWLNSETFTVEAVPPSTLQIPAPPEGQAIIGAMLRALLADRFKLAVRRSTREEQMYDLVIDKGGSKLKEGSVGQGIRMGRGELVGTGAPMFLLVRQLSAQLGRIITDKTGLTGRYDFTLKWTPEFDSPAGRDGAAVPPSPDSAPSIFAALLDLGIRLQATKGPVEIIVVDHAERPDPN